MALYAYVALGREDGDDQAREWRDQLVAALAEAVPTCSGVLEGVAAFFERHCPVGAPVTALQGGAAQLAAALLPPALAAARHRTEGGGPEALQGRRGRRLPRGRRSCSRGNDRQANVHQRGILGHAFFSTRKPSSPVPGGPVRIQPNMFWH